LRQRATDLSPYLVILSLVLLTRLISPIQQGLSMVALNWCFDAYGGSCLPLYHPGMILFLGLALAAMARGRAGMLPKTPAAADASVGPAWPILAPFVGEQGTFITGSAAASSILFTDLQKTTSQSLGLPAHCRPPRRALARPLATSSHRATPLPEVLPSVWQGAKARVSSGRLRLAFSIPDWGGDCIRGTVS
jgi:hypothetical protein